MKKTALLLCLFMVSVMMPQDVWATDGITGTTEITIKSSSAGHVSDLLDAYYTANNLDTDQKKNTWKASVTKITLQGDPYAGQFNGDDLSALSYASGFTAVTEVDMTEAQFVKSSGVSVTTDNSYLLFHDDAEANSYTSALAAGTKAVIGGSLYKWSQSGNRWNYVGYEAPIGATNINYFATQSAMEAATGSPYSVGDYAKVPNQYMYCQMNVTTGNSWNYLSTSNPGGTVVDHTDRNASDANDWLECNLGDRISTSTVGDKIKVLRFFQLQEVNGIKEWVHVTPSTRPLDRENGEGGTEIVYVGERVGADINNLDPSSGVLGSYIRFDVYYELIGASHSWGQGQSYCSESYVDADFEYSERESHTSSYSNGQWVRMGNGGYSYYQLAEGASWESQGYTSGTQVDGPKSTIGENGDRIDQYAVVNGTVKVYDGSQWSETVSNYSDMKFTYWAPTLETATTSRYADESIGDKPFEGCIKLTTVKYLSGNVTGFTDHKISEGYNTENRTDLNGTGLSVFIGKDVTKIDANAFIRCDVLTSLTFDTSYTTEEKELATAYYNDETKNVPRPVYPKDLTIGDEAFSYCSRLSSVEFPNRVISIGREAFKEAGTLASTMTVTFERRVTKTKEENGQTVPVSTSSIDYDHDLTIGTGAFYGCIKLEEIELPIRLSEMGNDAFKLTSSLTNVFIREDLEDARLKTIPSGAFEVSAVTDVVIPRSVTEIQPKAFGSCYHLKTVTFQEQLETPQEPLIVRTGAFATGDESKYQLTDVYVNIDPNDRLLVCEYDAFAFITLVGQTDVTNSKATLHFINNKDKATNDRNWNYYAGEWKKGLAFTQSDLNSMKDGYTGYRGAQQPTVASDGLVASCEPANGWQQFAASKNVDIVLTGNYLRTYSTNIPHYIPIIAATGDYLYDIYRVTNFSDGWHDADGETPADDVFDRDKANRASREASALKVSEELTENEETRLYVPMETGLILKVHGNSENYYIYQDVIDPEKATKTYPYNPNTASPSTNLLYPSCIDEGNNKRTITEGEGENTVTVTKVIINPTIPYPIGDISSNPSNKYRIFGFAMDNSFKRSKPNVMINQDMAYLKLPCSMFRWANEGLGTTPGYDDNNGSSPARITVIYADDESEITGIKTTVATTDSRIDGYYSVQGVKLSRPQRSGLYIHNGKKVFIK